MYGGAKDKLIHKVLTKKPNGKRPRGRPRQCWFDRVNKYLENLGTTRTEDANDRGVMRELVEVAKSLNGL